VRWPPAWELLVRESLVSKGSNVEAEGSTALEAIARQQPVKT
jgi:hypothetical protein